MRSACRTVLGLAVALTVGCTGKGGADEANGAASKFPPAPAYAHETTQGASLDLAKLEGQVVLLNVWATWCEPCKKELPELARLHQTHASQGFTVVAVAADAQRNAVRVRRMAADYGLPFPVIHDAQNQVMQAFEVVGFPTTILIGRDGTIRWRRDGMIMDGDRELSEQLALALAEAAS